MGITILGFSKQEFWDSSLREINDMMICHIDVNDPKKQKERKQIKLTPIDAVF
jgi:hypothetical protein